MFKHFLIKKYTSIWSLLFIVVILCSAIITLMSFKAPKGLAFETLDKLSGADKQEMLDRIAKLNKSAEIGDLDSVNYLLKQGVIIDAKYNNHTALLIAAANNHPKVCDVLLKAGAHARSVDRVNTADSNGLMPADYAAHNPETLRVFLDAGVPIESKGWYGQTMLFEAIDANAVDSVKLLIQRGANVNAKSTEMDCGMMHIPSLTPLQLASFYFLKNIH